MFCNVRIILFGSVISPSKVYLFLLKHSTLEPVSTKQFREGLSRPHLILGGECSEMEFIRVVLRPCRQVATSDSSTRCRDGTTLGQRVLS